MEWTSFDFDMSSEIDSVVGSRPELDFDINELPQLELDDDRFITDPNGWFGTQLIFHTYGNRPERIFNLDLSDYEMDSTFVDPILTIPPTPSDNDTTNIECHFKVPKVEHHFKEEPSSESEDESYLRDFEFTIPSSDAELKLPIEVQKCPSEYKVYGRLEDLVKKEPKEYDDMGYPKPPYSYACLIAMALKNSQSGALPVSKIYSFICAHFPYFKTAPNGWKNSIRHNLSLNKSFDKIDKPTDSKRGGLWTINPLKTAKMDLEVQKWSQKDPFAIKRAMTSPDLLELLERGEVKFNDDLSEGSGDELTTNSVTGSYDESSHEDEGDVGEGFCAENNIFEDHDYSSVNFTVRARCVYQPVNRKTPMKFSASDAFCEVE